MGAYTKATINSGDTITSTWGNTVQTQFDNVVGTADTEFTKIKAVFMDVSQRSLNVVTRDANNRITQVTEKSGATVLRTFTFTRNATDGKIDSFTEVGNGTTNTYTINRDATTRQVTSITKTSV